MKRVRQVVDAVDSFSFAVILLVGSYAAWVAYDYYLKAKQVSKDVVQEIKQVSLEIASGAANASEMFSPASYGLKMNNQGVVTGTFTQPTIGEVIGASLQAVDNPVVLGNQISNASRQWDGKSADTGSFTVLNTAWRDSLLKPSVGDMMIESLSGLMGDHSMTRMATGRI